MHSAVEVIPGRAVSYPNHIGQVNVPSLLLALRRDLRLDHLLDNLCLLDKECTDDSERMNTNECGHQEHSNRWNVPGLDAVAASRASIWSVYSFLPLGDGGILAGPESGDLDTKVGRHMSSSLQ